MGQQFIIQGRLDGLNELIKANRSGWQAGSGNKKKNQRKVVEALIEHIPRFYTDQAVALEITWYEPNRRRDVDNITAATKYILDGMVEYGTIPNDNQNFVKEIRHRVEIDKENPRIEIKIFENGEVLR